MLAMLREKGVAKREPAASNAFAKVTSEFERYLLQEPGLSPATLLNYVPVIEQFLSERFGGETPDVRLLCASDITKFVVPQANRLTIHIMAAMAEHEREMISSRTKAALDAASSIAKDCAPYLHPKLASIEHSGKDGGPLVIERIERVIVDPQHSDTQSFRPAAKTVRNKGAHGGRGSGKSHFFAEALVEKCLTETAVRAVCIREIQKSLEQSVKRLIEDKILKLGVGRYFEVLDKAIRTPGGGLILFQGMQNHTAESIKSLEGYDLAWVEEAQALSKRSLQLLRPTIRKPGSELWFAWNPASGRSGRPAVARAGQTDERHRRRIELAR